MKKALVVAGGSVDGIILKDEYDIVICADSGYDNACKLGIKCTLFVGDMDSVKSEVSCKDKVLLPKDKDLTDTEAALIEAEKRGFADVDLIGAVGTRFDHSVANLGLLKKYLNKGIKVRIVDAHNEITAINNRYIISGRKGETLSVIPADTKVSGITIKGFKYPLEKADLYIGSTLGISNIIIENEAEITLESGTLYIFISRD